MGSAEWSKMITFFIACVIKPGILVMATVVFAFHFSFLKTLLIGSLAGITGSVIFGFLSEEAIILYEYCMNKLFPRRSKNKFTKANRRLVNLKHNFGSIGIAALSPLLLSLPLGCFLAIRFFGNRNRTILYMSISSVAWIILLYFIYNGFYDSLKKLFE